MVPFFILRWTAHSCIMYQVFDLQHGRPILCNLKAMIYLKESTQEVVVLLEARDAQLQYCSLYHKRLCGGRVPN